MDENKDQATAAVVTETKPEIAVVGKKKIAKTGDVIQDVATEVEGLSKTKALNEAERLAQDIELNYFKLGGVLKLINDNSWFEGFPDFATFVFESFGFQGRKGRYLITIYDNLVTKQIPWEKVSHLGWTKLKDLAPVITNENVDEWVKKAEACTVLELQGLLKVTEGVEGSEKAAKTTDEVVKMSFKLKPDQAEAVTQALAKAKGELKTEYDTVALENICAGYIGGNTTVNTSGVKSFQEQVAAMGFNSAVETLADMFPEYDLVIQAAEAADQTAEQAQA